MRSLGHGVTGLTDVYSAPARRRRRTAAAALAAVAAVLGTALGLALPAGPALAAAPVLTSAPALAAPFEATPPGSTACDEPRPYGASASADLLHLHTLELPALGIGPLADVRVASTGAGMAAEAEVAAASAARDVAANLLGLDAVGLLPAGGVGHRVHQLAPPTHQAPAEGSGAAVDLGLLRSGAGTTSAYATWNQQLRCGATTGPASIATVSLAEAEVLPTAAGQALVSLPADLASRTEAGLVARSGAPAARAVAGASLTELRLFAGSGSEVSVRVVSEPQLLVTATGRPDTSSVTYHAPVLEVSGPGIGTERLDEPGAHLEVAIPDASGAPELAGLPVLAGEAPLADLLAGVDTELLSQLSAGPNPTDRPLPLSGLPGFSDPERAAAPDHPTSGAAILRLSIGELEETVDKRTVRAAAASVRVQIVNGQPGAETVLDLGLGMLAAAATAPAATAPAATGPPDGDDSAPPACEECPADGLPETTSTFAILAGAGILLLVAGRFLLLAAQLRASLSRARG